MKLWILIADAGRARLFTWSNLPATAARGLTEVEGFIHPQSRTPDSRLVSDRPGRVRRGLGGSAVTAMPRRTDPRQGEAARFAADLAAILRHACERNEFERLALVAPPHFLGLLRERLDDTVATRVVASVHKDLTLTDVADLPAHLSGVFVAAVAAV